MGWLGWLGRAARLAVDLMLRLCCWSHDVQQTGMPAGVKVEQPAIFNCSVCRRLLFNPCRPAPAAAQCVPRAVHPELDLPLLHRAPLPPMDRLAQRPHPGVHAGCLGLVGVCLICAVCELRS